MNLTKFLTSGRRISGWDLSSPRAPTAQTDTEEHASGYEKP